MKSTILSSLNLKKILIYTKFLFALLLFPAVLVAQRNVTPLKGVWQFQLDSLNSGEDEQWYKNTLSLKIRLPGSTDEGGFGKKHIDGTPLYDGQPEIYRLARKRVYIGAAWYRKDITFSSDRKNKLAFLKLERCMWQTKLWINGVYVGEQNSLSIPHQYEISNLLKAGKNSITIKVDNSPQVNLGSWSHGYSPEVQTIWNGVIGKIELHETSKIHLKDIQVYPSVRKQLLAVKLSINNPRGQNIFGWLKLTIKDKNKSILNFSTKIKNNTVSKPLTLFIPMKNKLKVWNENTPQLYQLQVESSFNFNNYDRQNITFGVRDLAVENSRLVLNGSKIFLRGEHDAGSFPLTGYPSMNKNKWLEIFRKGKSYGLNHWRFHSWCPPEAAFEAADETGMLIEAELPLFSQTWENSLVGTDYKRDEFLKSELKRILDTYGNHPSFALMCMGNELKGNPLVLEEWVKFAKKYDTRHLYAGNANLEAMGIYERLKDDDFQVAHAGKINGKRFERRMKDYFETETPNTVNNYSYTIVPPYNGWPIIGHEVGQWMVFPDFSEISKFNGVLKPRNFEIFKSRLRQKGMLNQAGDFLLASGKLSGLLYREEIERFLRTPGIAGFQLLDLRDYPGQGSATVGLLNQFWGSKDLVTPEEFRGFCNDVTLLLQMPKRTWLNNEIFSAGLIIPNYSSSDISKVDIKWQILNNGELIKQGILKAKNLQQGEVNTIGRILFDLSGIRRASKLTVKLEEAHLNIRNNYEVFVYPEQGKVDIPSEITIATSADSVLLKKVENGATVLLVTDKLVETERMAFTTPFWSTIIFDYQVKTMGLFCNPQHPAFKNFPTDFYSNWQWWELTKDARVLRLNKTAADYRPVLQVIDHPVRNDKLGAIVETKIGRGKLLLCTFDILSNHNRRYVARQLLKSIIDYMASPNFSPQEHEGLTKIIFDKTNTSASDILSVKSLPENSESPALFAFDGDSRSAWKTNEDTITLCVVELNRPRFVTGCNIEISTQHANQAAFSVYVTDDPKHFGQSVIDGKVPGENTFEAKQWDNGFTVQKGKKGKFVVVEIKPQLRRNSAIQLNEIKFNFGD